MSRLELQTCALDRAGIPDLSDLQWVQVEASSIIATTIHIAYDYWADPVLAYPFAAIETHDGLMYSPLEPETDEAKLAASVGILRDAFDALNAS